MAEANPATSFASLAPRLLARKGGAKPAMRSQMEQWSGTASAQQLLSEMDEAQLNNLGWNDMGEDLVRADDGEAQPQAEAEVTKRAKKSHKKSAASTTKKAAKKPRKAENAAVSAANDEHATALSAAQHEPRRRAAFTLRLDPVRHLKLRIAATLQDRSAQALVAEALDRALDEIAGLDALTRDFSQSQNRPQQHNQSSSARNGNGARR